MIRDKTTPLTKEGLRKLDFFASDAVRNSVREDSNLDEADLYYSMIPSSKMTAVQKDLRWLISCSFRSFYKLIRKRVKDGKSLERGHAVFFKAVEEIARIPNKVSFEPSMFKEAISLGRLFPTNASKDAMMRVQALTGVTQTPVIKSDEAVDEDEALCLANKKNIVDGYSVGPYAAWFYRTMDVLAVRHGLPLATNLLRRYAIARHWISVIYKPYMRSFFGTKDDLVWQATERGDLIIERGYTRDILGDFGESRRKAYGSPTLSNTKDGIWYENQVDGLFVRTSSFKLHGAIGAEAFVADYPYLLPLKRGVVMLHEARNCNYQFNWHINLLINEVLNLAATGEMVPGNVKQWTIANIIGRVEKSRRKEREMRKVLAQHTYDLIEYCISQSVKHWDLDTALIQPSDPNKGEMLLVPLRQGQNPRHIALLLSSTTQFLRFCLGGARAGANGYEPMVDISKVSSKEELETMRLPVAGSIGRDYLDKVVAGVSTVVVFYHKLKNDVILPVGALEIHKDANSHDVHLGQFRGYRNGKIPEMYRSSIRIALNNYIRRYPHQVTASANELSMQGLKFNRETKTFNFK